VINSALHFVRVVALAMLIAGAIALVGDGSSTARQTPLSATARTAEGVSNGAQGPFAVGKIVVRFIDTRRLVHFPRRRPQPRPLVTVILYPAIGDPSRVDGLASPPARSSGPFPLVVFGHGLDSTPDVYARMLEAWARAGYVVAAPIFPLSNANAPGGADESDIINQPADMSFVITRILAASVADHGLLSRLVDPHGSQSLDSPTAVRPHSRPRTTRAIWTDGLTPRSSCQAQRCCPVGTSVTRTRHFSRRRAPPTSSTSPATPTSSSTLRIRPSSS